jgi:hypothetical protein
MLYNELVDCMMLASQPIATPCNPTAGMRFMVDARCNDRMIEWLDTISIAVNAMEHSPTPHRSLLIAPTRALQPVQSQ